MIDNSKSTKLIDMDLFLCPITISWYTFFAIFEEVDFLIRCDFQIGLGRGAQTGYHRYVCFYSHQFLNFSISRRTTEPSTGPKYTGVQNILRRRTPPHPYPHTPTYTHPVTHPLSHPQTQSSTQTARHPAFQLPTPG